MNKPDLKFSAMFLLLSITILISAKMPDHNVITSGTALYASGGYIYTSGGRTLYRLDRKTGDFSALYTGRNHLYRFAVSADNTKALCYFEGEPFIYYLIIQKGPAKAVKIPLNMPSGFSDQLDSLYFDASGRYAIAVSSSFSSQAVAFYADLTKPGVSVNSLSEGGAVFSTAGPDLLYMTYSKKKYGSFVKTSSESIRWKNIITGAEKTVHKFESNPSNITAVDSESPDYAGIRLLDAQKQIDKILIYKDGKGIPYADVQCPREINGKNFSIERIHLPADAKNLILGVNFSNSDTFETFIALDLKTGKASIASDGLLYAIKFKSSYRQFGNTRSGILYKQLEESGDLLLVDIKKRAWSRTSIKPFAKVPKVEWGGLTYFFSDPDEFFTAIEKGGGRYFMKYPMKSLKVPAERIPDGDPAFEFIQTYKE